MITPTGSTHARIERTTLEQLKNLKKDNVTFDTLVRDLVDLYLEVRHEAGIEDLTIREAERAVVNIFREYQKEHPEMKASLLQNVRLGVSVGKIVSKKYQERKMKNREGDNQSSLMEGNE